jgi:hypothetical protein
LPTKGEHRPKGKSVEQFFFVVLCTPMELVMYFGDDFIASQPLDSELISKPGYISALKRSLLKENEEVLRYADNEPDFLILNFAFSDRADFYTATR